MTHRRGVFVTVLCHVSFLIVRCQVGGAVAIDETLAGIMGEPQVTITMAIYC